MASDDQAKEQRPPRERGGPTVDAKPAAARDRGLPKARLPRGFEDRTAAQIRAADAMIQKIKAVYERFGFEPVETPLVEFTEALGKFLPDLDRPNEGVFSFQDDDEQWLSLRYDLTAPLARYVAENYDRLPKPFRSYRAGWVFRNEKPGPGRFRQFLQFDADTVGASSPAADAEMCMMMADALEAVGIPRGQYVIKVNSRKVLDGVMEAAGVTDQRQKLTVLRTLDKKDRLGPGAVRELLMEGRRDESGDFTSGAGLDSSSATTILAMVGAVYFETEPEPASLLDSSADIGKVQDYLAWLVGELQSRGASFDGVLELQEVRRIVRSCGFGIDRISMDTSIVRGLEYYTGAVFEAEVLFDTVNDKGEKVRFGSVASGGRYDGLVGRFRGENVPATGMSMGVSRLLAALAALKGGEAAVPDGPVVVLVMDRARMAETQHLVQMLRAAPDPRDRSGERKIAAELYLGDSGMKAQMKYADRRNAPAVVIQGGSEVQNPDGTPRTPRMVQIKDLAAGKRAAAAIADNAAWREERPGQFEVTEGEMVAAIQSLLTGRGT